MILMARMEDKAEIGGLEAANERPTVHDARNVLQAG
jgi:hypothetical protein